MQLESNDSGLWVGTWFTRTNDDHHSSTKSTVTQRLTEVSFCSRNTAANSSALSVRCFFDDVGGEGVVAGNADGVAGQGVRLLPGCVAAGHEDVAQRGEEDLAVGGRHQVVEDGVDGRADVEQHVGQHVEVVVEVVHVAARINRREKEGKQKCEMFGFDAPVVPLLTLC